jgi:hypothetical protein
MYALPNLSRLFLHAERTKYAQLTNLHVASTLSYSRVTMPELLADLKRRRSELLEELSRLGNFRAGSITALTRRCGKPGCRCSQPDDPGHGPNLRLTYKLNGKTHSESLPDQTSIRKAQAEIAEFREFQQWARDFIEVNAKICRLSSAAGPTN